jgi:hypothetical protein
MKEVAAWQAAQEEENMTQDQSSQPYPPVYPDPAPSTPSLFQPQVQAQAASFTPSSPPTTAIGWLHRDLNAAGAALSHSWPIVKALAANPLLDELLEAALSASGGGVAEEVFRIVIDSLNGATARAAASAQQGQAPQ